MTCIGMSTGVIDNHQVVIRVSRAFQQADQATLHGRQVCVQDQHDGHLRLAEVAIIDLELTGA